ncbi:MAG: tripartite tricarboxylate transporter substrate binding protein [Proteobacteria bacterium]|nr:tripartite tricarboxylate transporter substrate binding protein [Burkholderiales bacterium]
MKTIILIGYAAIAHCVLAAAASGAADSYPQRPLRFIVPFPPGGANDIVARLVGPLFTERFGQQVVVDNRPGASGTIALELTARAQPDGYTFIVGNNTSNAIVPVMFAKRMRVDPAQELTGISMLAAIQHVVVAAAKFPPTTFQELVAYAKSRPGQLNYNAPLGGHPHLDMLAFLAATGTQMVHIPSKGAGETVPSLLRGEAQLSNTNVASVIGLLRAGQLKAYAITGESRLPELPDVPTFTEVGLKGVGSINWVGLFAPAKTPPAIINQLHRSIVEMVGDARLKESSAKLLVPFVASASPAEFNAFVASERKRWEDIVKTNQIKLE